MSIAQTVLAPSKLRQRHGADDWLHGHGRALNPKNGAPDRDHDGLFQRIQNISCATCHTGPCNRQCSKREDRSIH